MSLSRRIARPLLASIFVVGGFDAVRNPGEKAKKAAAVTEPVSESVDFIPSDPETLVRVNGFVQIGAGILLATGKFRRLAALALMGSLVPTTYAGHRFWEETDQAVRKQQTMHFLKNLGLLGGLILVVVDSEKTHSRRSRHKSRRGQHEAVSNISGTIRATAGRVGPTSEATVARVSKASRRSVRASRRSLRQASAAGRRAGHEVHAAALGSAQRVAEDGPDALRHAHDAVKDAVRDSGGGAVQAVQQATSVVASAIRELEPLAQTAAHSGVDVAKDALSNLREQLPSS